MLNHLGWNMTRCLSRSVTGVCGMLSNCSHVMSQISARSTTIVAKVLSLDNSQFLARFFAVFNFFCLTRETKGRFKFCSTENFQLSSHTKKWGQVQNNPNTTQTQLKRLLSFQLCPCMVHMFRYYSMVFFFAQRYLIPCDIYYQNH